MLSYTKNTSAKLTVIDLFAGCGGLSLGLEIAGFMPLLVNEISPDAMATYLANRTHFPALSHKYSVADIKSLTGPNQFRLTSLLRDMCADYGINVSNGDLDLVVGGPPCQGFSGIGHRRSYSVDKIELPGNHLYQDFISFISLAQPKFFLFENVKGLLSAKWTEDGHKGEIWDDVRTALSSIAGYERTGYALVHAKEYGVPQNRPRILMVGIRDDIILPDDLGLRANGYLPEAFGKAPDLIDIFSDLVDPTYRPGGATIKYPESPSNPIQRWFRTAPNSSEPTNKDAPLEEQEYSNHAPDIQYKFAYMIANNGIIPSHMVTKKFAQKVLPARWGISGPSITATSLPDDYVHYLQPRSLTVREWARLQTFPDWYVFRGKRTTGGLRRAGNPRQGIYDRELPKYTQIGNAVPVFLAISIGNHIAKLLGRDSVFSIDSVFDSA